MTQTVPEAPAVIHMKNAVPTFLVGDVGATARWYSEHLGFDVAGTFPASEPYAYASLQRWRRAHKQQPYGDWEFEVRDPNGYVLVFSG